ncbi:hypothetical protein RSAG8_05120, partial [Rhizoctonia solani AG-8 WAC10335]
MCMEAPGSLPITALYPTRRKFWSRYRIVPGTKRSSNSSNLSNDESKLPAGAPPVRQRATAFERLIELVKR